MSSPRDYYMCWLKYYLHDGGFSPIRAYLGSVGWDLSSPVDCTIAPQSYETIDLKISFLFDIDQYGIIMGRSGIAKNNGILTHIGLIDPDYSASVSCVLFNFGQAPFVIKTGDAICQLVVHTENDVTLVESTHSFATSGADKGERGARGFGSSTDHVRIKQLAMANHRESNESRRTLLQDDDIVAQEKTEFPDTQPIDND